MYVHAKSSVSLFSDWKAGTNPAAYIRPNKRWTPSRRSSSPYHSIYTLYYVRSPTAKEKSTVIIGHPWQNQESR